MPPPVFPISLPRLDVTQVSEIKGPYSYCGQRPLVGSLSSEQVNISKDLAEKDMGPWVLHKRNHLFQACALAAWFVGCQAKLEIKTSLDAPSEVDFSIEDLSMTVEGTRITWQSHAKVSRYQVIIAEDAGCTESAKEESDLADSWVTFQDLPDGDYYVCVFGFANDSKFPAKNNGMALHVDRTPPVVNVGLDRITRVPVDLIPTVDDTAVSYTWEKISGPGELTFGDVKAKQTSVSAVSEGDFIIRLTVTDAVGNAAYDELIFTWDTTPPLLDVGGDVTIGVTTTIAAAVAGASVVQWEKVSGPGTITFGSATDATTTVTADQDGVYVLRLSARDIAGNTGFDELTFTWDTTNPTVSVGADRAEKALFTLTPTYANGDVFVWTQQSGPGTLTFGTPNAASTTISADTDGTYTVRLTLTNTLSGNTAFDEFVLKWDTSVPNFTSLSLANDAADSYVKNADVTANAPFVSAVVGTGFEDAAYKIAAAAADCSSAVTYDQTVNTLLARPRDVVLNPA